MAGPRSLALNKLVKDNEMLSEVEVSSVVAPLLERLCALHAQGEAHGNVSLATVTICVIEPADGTIHLPDAGCCNEAAQRPCAMCQQSAEGASPAADIWSVGIIAVQLLLGRPCRESCNAAIVAKSTGQMPVLPRGTTLECIDFLMDCLAPRAEDRASAAALLKHDFLRTISPPGGPNSADPADSLADSLADVLLISKAGKQQRQACRPMGVPSLKAKGRVSFTVPSHTARCLQCRCAKECAHQQLVQLPRDMPLLAIDKCIKSSVVSHVSPKLQVFSPNTANSAASTKRKFGDRDAPISAPKRKCSCLVKYLSPAILPVAANFDLLNAPALLLGAQ
eukprot:CAMPEP_0179491036 /NCGR_PEP_ID=MMETSP0799-20121207/65837_1 /TAXON_ID=46947 /ORGANISM="Geminigera cryophila, Strain CCMP2564" /LENGTH=336 /DNA_ID=CAMNT_0021307387 /DNA_START=214 /DNA_END=1224 /DNA_ORIENTATION=-